MNQEATTNNEDLEENEAVNQDEQDENEAIRSAFEESISNDKEEDEVKMDMIQAGASFKNVTRLYNQFMIDAGLALSKSDRNQIVESTLEEADIESEEGFNAAVAALLESVKGSTERSAAALVRSYAKKNDINAYTKPKNEGTGQGRTGFASLYYEFLRENPACTKEEAKAYINGEGEHPDTTENIRKHESHYLKIWKLANDITKKYQ